MRAALLVRRNYRSPRFLAEGLKRMLCRVGVEADLILGGVTWLEAESRQKASLRNRVTAELSKLLVKRLSKYDLIIVVDTMQAFRDVVDLKPVRRLSKPVLHYAVFYVGGSEYWLERLPENATSKYDGYLSVSGVHDIIPVEEQKVHYIGLDVQPEHLFTSNCEKFIALLDFPRQGYEEQRECQLQILAEMGIETIVLKGEYTFAQIEDIYRQVSVVFLASPEAFGVPIVQLQHYGALIICPDVVWPKRHAILPNGAVFFDEESPCYSDNFIFYKNAEDLKDHLSRLKSQHDPLSVRATLLEQQPQFCQGDLNALWSAVRDYC